MKFTIGWLSDYIEFFSDSKLNLTNDNKANLHLLNNILSPLGFPIEHTYHKYDYENFVIGRINKISSHMNADSLQICEVQTTNEVLLIVCGANNIYEGMMCAVAKIGAIIPQTMKKLKASKIRGVASEGMLCSAQELGLNLIQAENGILDLKFCNLSIKLTDNLNQILNFDGDVYQIEITANRGDMLSIYGIARELAAAEYGKLKPINLYSLRNEINMKFVNDNHHFINKTNLCTSLYSTELQLAHSKSSYQIQKRLLDVGIKPHSLAVDVTNYIAHALGQPLHAFDRKILTKSITVTMSNNEKYTNLKNNTHNLDENMIVMKHENEVVSLPGIIGGKFGCVNDKTTNILLEAATFDANTIRKTYRKLNCITEASKRFSHEVDGMMTSYALLKAAALLIENGAQSIDNMIYTAQSFVPVKREIELSYDKLRKMLGVEISNVKITQILQNLGFEKIDDKYLVPSWRVADVKTEECLIEEVMRHYEIHNIPVKEISITFSPTYKFDMTQKIREYWKNHQLLELYHNAFMSQDAVKFFPQKECLRIANPLNRNQLYLRPTLLCQLLERVAEYSRYSWPYFGMFEIGKTYHDIDDERQSLAIIWPITNDWNTKFLSQFQRYKSNFESFLNEFFHDLNMNDTANFHYEQACSWHHNSKHIATFGTISDEILRHYNITNKIFVAEASLDQISYAKRAKYSMQQVIARDISVKMPSELTTSQAILEVKELLPPNVSFSVFDVYPSLLINERNIGFRITWHALQKTLTTKQIDNLYLKVQSKLKDLNCVIR